MIPGTLPAERVERSVTPANDAPGFAFEPQRNVGVTVDEMRGMSQGGVLKSAVVG